MFHVVNGINELILLLPFCLAFKPYWVHQTRMIHFLITLRSIGRQMKLKLWKLVLQRSEILPLPLSYFPFCFPAMPIHFMLLTVLLGDAAKEWTRLYASGAWCTCLLFRSCACSVFYMEMELLDIWILKINHRMLFNCMLLAMKASVVVWLEMLHPCVLIPFLLKIFTFLASSICFSDLSHFNFVFHI